MKLKEGIYEQVISNKIHEEIKNRENEINIQKEEIEKEEAKIVLSKYLQEVTKKSLSLLKNKDLNQTNRTLQSNNKLPINTSRRRRNKRK